MSGGMSCQSRSKKLKEKLESFPVACTYPGLRKDSVVLRRGDSAMVFRIVAVESMLRFSDSWMSTIIAAPASFTINGYCLRKE